MICLLPNKQNDDSVLELEDILTSGTDSLYRSRMDDAHSVAEFAIMSHNGKFPSVDFFHEEGRGSILDSVLYSKLLLHFGDEAMAITAKLCIFSREFKAFYKEKYGTDWEDAKREPFFEDVTEFLKLTNFDLSRGYESKEIKLIEDYCNARTGFDVICNLEEKAANSEKETKRTIEEKLNEYIAKEVEEESTKDEIQLLEATLRESSTKSLMNITDNALNKLAKEMVIEQRKVNYMHDYVQSVIDEAAQYFMKAWHIDNLTYENAVSNINSIAQDSDFLKNKTLVRCKFLQMLKQASEDLYRIKPVVEFAVNVINGNVTYSLFENFMSQMFEITKNTKPFCDLLIKNGYDILKNNGEISDTKLNSVIRTLSQNILDEQNALFGVKSKPSQFLTKLKQTMLFLTNAAFNCLGFISKANIIPTVAMSVLGFTQLGSLGVIIGMSAGIALGKILQNYYKEHAKQYGFDEFKNQLIATRYMLLACLSQDVLEESTDLRSKEYFHTYFSKLNIKNPDSFDKKLMSLLKNIDSLIKAIRYSTKTQNSNEQFLKQLEIYKDRIQEVLTHKQIARDTKSINEYQTNAKVLCRQYADTIYTKLYQTNLFFRDVKSQLDEIAKIEDEQKRNSEYENFFEQNPISVIMQLKTDHIGAYKYIFDVVLTDKDFDNSDNIYSNTKRTINESVELFNKVFDIYLEQYIKNYLAADLFTKLNKELRDRFYSNFKQWFETILVASGSSSLFIDKVRNNKTNTSPIVRLVQQKLQEIAKIAETEGGYVASELEAIRRKHSSLVNPINQFTPYMERDDDGKFTGYLKNSINRGKYNSQRRKFLKYILKKLGVSFKDFNNPEFKDEDTWKQYSIQLEYWEGGSNEFDEDGFLKQPKEGAHPRVNKRYTWLYYEKRILRLGKDGIETLSSIDRDISDILRQCTREIEVNGVKTKIALTNELPNNLKIRLLNLRSKKATLASKYDFSISYDENNVPIISNFLVKTNDLYKKFIEWNKFKKKIYKDGKTEYLYEKYEAVLNWYDSRIKDAENEGDIDLKQLLIKQKRTFKEENSRRVLSKEITKLFNSNFDYSDLDGLDVLLRSILNFISPSKIDDPTIIKYDVERVKSTDEKGTILYWSNFFKLWKIIIDIENRAYINREDSVEDDNSSSENSLTFNDIYANNDGFAFEEIYNAYSEFYNNTLNSQERLMFINPNSFSDFFKYYNGERISRFAQIKGIDVANLKTKLRSPLGVKEITVPVRMNGVTSEKTVSVDDITPDDIFPSVPVNAFSRTSCSYDNEQFDVNSDEYVQINTDYSENGKRIYDNSKEMEELENDELYKKLVEVLDLAWSKYGNINSNHFKLPQRQASSIDLVTRSLTPGSGVGIFKTIGRLFKSPFDTTNSIDNDYAEYDMAVYRPDGTIVNTIPMRWISDLHEAEFIDSDLVGSIIDFYTEAVKYEQRKKMAPFMEAIYFKLTGGFNQKENSGSYAVKDAMNRDLYGRSTVGFGVDGRMTKNDQKWAALSSGFRSAMHNKLMAHNWLSVFKNSYDSFCNILKMAIVGKHITPYVYIKNMVRSLPNAVAAAFSFTDSKPRNLTLALMHMNQVNKGNHERFKNTQKWTINKIFDDFATLEFEPIDYMANSLITDCIYDSYRLVLNPMTGKLEFMNHEEAEMAYANSESVANGRKEGYEAWERSEITLRKAYMRAKDGSAVLKSEYVDIIRPASKFGHDFGDGVKRSVQFETKIKTTIRSISAYCNGMLKPEDKNEWQRHYIGALVFSFRGWMITQYSEELKNGIDFQERGTLQNINANFMDSFYTGLKREKMIVNKHWEGQYNFSTGTVDRGNFVKLFRNVKQHLPLFIKAFLFIRENRFKLISGGMSNNEVYQMRNAICSLHLFIMTIAFTCLSSLWYNGDDDDDNKWFRALVYVSFLSSVQERFPQLGLIPSILGATDILKAVTVGVTLLDELDTTMNAVLNICQYIDTELLGKSKYFDIPENILSDDNVYSTYCINGTFKNESVLKKNLVRGLSVVNLDFTPFLASLDALNKIGDYAEDNGHSEINNSLPQWFKDTLFLDYNFNMYKNLHENAEKQRGRYYLSITPNQAINGFFDFAGYGNPFTFDYDSESGYDINDPESVRNYVREQISKQKDKISKAKEQIRKEKSKIKPKRK